ncbi:hypothetical protein TanjilG_32096 [Lupinus angustifolius]|uniref:Protein LURP-one-related 17 n=1 Tax=Lupinus angustifolius TaxID=3871 RepID=A0A4P1RFA1_LUPAN|nr:PREDICTED: protein LURP-one-related 17-like [Lupinus angustifolius]OIW09947.1 hypothetical protein TanjilG_32096 [Lupinus angustifolius]
MSCSFKSLSRAVYEEHQEHVHKNVEEISKYLITKGNLCNKSQSLTVWRKSLVFSCKGFTVIDSCGNLVYRVDNYTLHPDEVILMDASGNSVFTMRRRTKFGLIESWYVYEGEMENQCKRRSNIDKSRKNPVCCVKKSVNILTSNPKVQACVYRVTSDSYKQHAMFTIEGSYEHRTCKVLDEFKRVVVEIKMKEANSKNVTFGIEIFQLIVHPGFDPDFAMAIVLLLDQMFS